MEALYCIVFLARDLLSRECMFAGKNAFDAQIVD